MTDPRRDPDTIPIACILPEEELTARTETTVARLFAAVEETVELPDGYEFRFPAGDEWAARLTEFVLSERFCCPFFTFELRFEPDRGPVSLRLTGPEGVKQFIEAMLDG